MDMYTYTEPELTSFANQIKDFLVVALAKEEVIEADPEAVAATYAIVVVKGSRLGKLWNKARGIEDNGIRIAVVKCLDSANREKG